MKLCEACGQPILDPTVVRHITRAELEALSAWWWARSARGAGRVLGRGEQTIKNQLQRARDRNQCRKTLELAKVFAGQLQTMEELTQRNRRRAAA